MSVSKFEIRMNMEGEIEVIQTTTMRQDEFLRYAVDVRGVQKGVTHDNVTDLLPPENVNGDSK
jgi:hypothetical protein